MFGFMLKEARMTRLIKKYLTDRKKKVDKRIVKKKRKIFNLK